MTCFMQGLGHGACSDDGHDGYCESHREGAVLRASQTDKLGVMATPTGIVQHRRNWRGHDGVRFLRERS